MYDMFGNDPYPALAYPSSKLSRNGRWGNIKPPYCIAAFKYGTRDYKRKVYTSSSTARCAMNPIWKRLNRCIYWWTSRAGIVFCTCAAVAVTAPLREEVYQPPSRWNLARSLLPMMVVVRGSPRIHVRANGRESERVAAGRTRTSARSYARAVLRAVLGLRVSQEGIVGHGRGSE